MMFAMGVFAMIFSDQDGLYSCAASVQMIRMNVNQGLNFPLPELFLPGSTDSRLRFRPGIATLRPYN